MSDTPVRVAVTGAAGQIGYAILFRIASRNTDIHPIVVRPEHLAAVTVAVRPRAFIALHGTCSLIVFQAMMAMKSDCQTLA